MKHNPFVKNGGGLASSPNCVVSVIMRKDIPNDSSGMARVLSVVDFSGFRAVILGLPPNMKRCGENFCWESTMMCQIPNITDVGNGFLNNSTNVDMSLMKDLVSVPDNFCVGAKIKNTPPNLQKCGKWAFMACNPINLSGLTKLTEVGHGFCANATISSYPPNLRDYVRNPFGSWFRPSQMRQKFWLEDDLGDDWE